jgi:glycosyltransferase involved in cell wall biosynthesis
MTEPCAIVIPAWNEALTIGPVVQRARAQAEQVIVVDDGSTDATRVKAEAAGARVFRHGSNLGKGAALRTGLETARELGFRRAVTLDADGQHAPEEIPSFQACADATGCDLVVGNRMHASARMPWLRRAANRWLSRQLSRRAGRPLPDSQCGFRLLQLDVWARLSLHTEHFEVESETLLAFLAAGHRVEFVPIAVLRSPRPSRIRVVPDSVRWFRWWRQSQREAVSPTQQPLPATS